MAMILSDISDIPHGDRDEHYRKQYGAYDVPIDRRHVVCEAAWKAATAEMLDEIHTMLRHLCPDVEKTNNE